MKEEFNNYKKYYLSLLGNYNPEILNSKHVSIPYYEGRVEDLNYVYQIQHNGRPYYIEFANFAITHISTLLKESIPFHYSVWKTNSLLPYIITNSYFKDGKAWFKLYAKKK